MTYQGWTNRATWNVALHINNERPLYELAKGCSTYTEFRSHLFPGSTTPDGVSYTDPTLDLDELNEMVSEL